MEKIYIVGYEVEGHCEHCGRALKHCIRISTGQIVGATCLDKKMTRPKEYQGKKYRMGTEAIIRVAKVVQYKPAALWSRYGVSYGSTEFTAA